MFSSDRLGLKGIMEAFIERTCLGSLREHPEELALRFRLAQVHTAIREHDRTILEYRWLLELGVDPARGYNSGGRDG